MAKPELEIKVVTFELTLRDWFAGQAVSGLFVEGAVDGPENVAYEAYRLADAMLVERKKSGDAAKGDR